MERENQDHKPIPLRERLSEYGKASPKSINKALNIPPKKIVDVIDAEDFDPPDAIKLLQLCYWYFYGKEAAKKMRRDFGEKVEIELGIELSANAMIRVHTQSLEDPVLDENFTYLITKLEPKNSDNY